MTDNNGRRKKLIQFVLTPTGAFLLTPLTVTLGMLIGSLAGIGDVGFMAGFVGPLFLSVLAHATHLKQLETTL